MHACMHIYTNMYRRYNLYILAKRRTTFMTTKKKDYIHDHGLMSVYSPPNKSGGYRAQRYMYYMYDARTNRCYFLFLSDTD